MKLKVSVNFDFGELSSDMNSLIDKYISGYANNVANTARSKINNGLSPDIKKSTKSIREWHGFPTSPPLKASGHLYKNIKKKNNIITMPEYGLLQNNGFVTAPNSLIPNKKVPARSFIEVNDEQREKLEKTFVDNVNKALSSKKVVVSLS
tara:strand:- start:378 stop:827 length:450 start_codon:yes stop_codon:yes gene_type:complete